MGSLENLVTQIQGLSGSVEDIAHLHNILKLADESLHSEPSMLSAVLDQVDPAKHSLGYLYILEAFTSGPVSEEQALTLVPILTRFINFCDAQQIRLAPDKFVSVCKRFKDHVLLIESPLRGVSPMRTAVRKLQTTSEHLTTLHPEFLLLCLLTKSYKIGLSVLEDDIFDVDQPRDLFLYCYYGSML